MSAILNKSYTDEDWFWYFANYNYYHTPFINDYNLCKFNLVMETQAISSSDTEKDLKNTNQFFSEKTLKAFEKHRQTCAKHIKTRKNILKHILQI